MAKWGSVAGTFASLRESFERTAKTDAAAQH
jgi:hypothetical protein